MVYERTFIHYQIKLELPNDRGTELWQGEFLTPNATWESVDLPLWTHIKEQFHKEYSHSTSWSQVKHLFNIEKLTQSPSLYGFEGISVTPMDKRRELLLWVAEHLTIKTLPLDPTDTKFVTNLAGRKLLLQEVYSVWQQKEERFLVEQADNQAHTNENEYEFNFLVTLQKLYLQGFFDWSSAVGRGTNKPYCRRCGYGLDQQPHSLVDRLKQQLYISEPENLIQVICSSCGQENCSYCPRCIEMGRVKACEPLLSWTPHSQFSTDQSEVLETSPREPKETPSNNLNGSLLKKSVPFNWTGELSPAQQEASTKLVNFVHPSEQKGQPTPQVSLEIPQASQRAKQQSGSSKDFLVWAVTGAGKTEILFETIHRSLLKQQKVLITSPRRDVILELAPRLQEAFPQTVVRTLHAESKEKFLAGDLFLATTHQTLRFEHFFDLVIIDEEDAFPFHLDPMLPYAVKRAKKPEATTVYLTATPRADMIRQAETSQLAYALISKRYHGHPLAVPVIQPIGQWRKQIEKKALLTPILHYVTHLARHQRFGYLFVPHIRDLALVKEYLQETVVPYLQKQPFISTSAKVSTYLQQMNIEVVHAQHPDRTAIVQRFRQQQIHILLTTTILERGVTIPYSDAAIIGSDDPVFDTAALIQIAGRVGRKLEDPVGKVWFFPEVRTNAQLRCVEQIKRWNKL